jgi:glycine oxidase
LVNTIDRVSEVLVIGGGIIGCGIARALSTLGHQVTLVDARGIGRGASRASAGMLAPYTEGQHDRALQALGIRSLELYNGLLAELAAEGELVEYTRNGSIEIALDDDDLARIDAMAAALSTDGVAFERLGAGALATLEPGVTPASLGGLRIASHGAVDVPALVQALWRSAASRGATHVAASVTAIASASGGVQVDTTAGRLTVPNAVLSAGCWAGQITPAAATLPVGPVRGQLLVLRLGHQILRHAIWGPRCYLVPWHDGTVLVGATVEDAGFDEHATAQGVASLLNAATELLPALAGASFEEVRVGLRPGTPDDRPIVGPSSQIDGLVYATGHYRNGALLAPLTANAVACLIEGRPLDRVWEPCSPVRYGL